MTTRVDSHHHLWDLAVRGQPWITDAMAPICRGFGMDELAPEANAAGITATVVVQTVPDLTETGELVAAAEALTEALDATEQQAILGGSVTTLYRRHFRAGLT